MITDHRSPITDSYGLIGYPLGHSFSPDYFRKKFLGEGIAARYSALPLERIADFPALLKRHPHLRGLNVTIPHKEAIIPYLDRLHPDAKAIGAVNCIVVAEGRLIGYNVDWIGFRDSLQPLLGAHHNRALVLGTGGASKAVRFALQQFGVDYTLVSRAGAVSYNDVTAALVAAHPLIINTTPLGTAPAVDAAPVLPYGAIGPRHLLYDLVYNPSQTRFLALGAAQGATVKNGLEMLERQADASWEIWNSP